MNEIDRKMIKQALNAISGRLEIPLLRWHMKREDGSFDGSDGRVRSEKELIGKKGVLIFVEEVQLENPPYN